jgi:hypothetical protein|tara:strand:- start:1443 stop:1886 length:444 start_codon:yes stop_codon:yes gene_type:complete
MADGTEKLPRGIRNKNPGNIKLGTNWDGLADEQSDPVFCVFKEAIWGIRALMRILLTYRFTHNRKNIDSIIKRWAPPSENDTDAYIVFVSKKMGIEPMEIIDNSIEAYLPLVKAIIQMENGMQPYDDELIVEGMYKAWEGHPTGSSA